MCEGVLKDIERMSGRNRDSRGGTVQPGASEGSGGGRELPAPRCRAYYCSARAGVEIGGLGLPRLWGC